MTEFILPWSQLDLITLFVWVYTSPHRSSKATRWAVFSFIAFNSYRALQCRATGLAYGIFIGLSAALTTMQAAIYVFKDVNPPKDKWRRLWWTADLLIFLGRQPGKASIIQLPISWIGLDILKTIMIQDPYFAGEGTGSQYHTLLTFLAIGLAIMFVTSSVSIFTDLPGFGDFNAVLDRGLIGFWNVWWHQTFRHIFTELSPNRYSAFILSGLLHYAGATTMIKSGGEWKVFIPFALQPIGVAIQIRLNRLKSKTLNVLFTTVFLWASFSILVDPFAASGLWLYEPVPVSPIGCMTGIRPCICWKPQEWFDVKWYGVVVR